MSSTVEAVAALAAAVDGLLESRPDALAGPDVVGVLAALEVQRCRLDAVDVRWWPRPISGGWPGNSAARRRWTCWPTRCG